MHATDLAFRSENMSKGRREPVSSEGEKQASGPGKPNGNNNEKNITQHRAGSYRSVGLGTDFFEHDDNYHNYGWQRHYYGIHTR